MKNSRKWNSKTEEIKVEKNVPMPVRGEKSRYPFAKMEVGDSFEVDAKHRSGVRSTAWEFQIYNKGHQFATRVIGDKIRVWRTK